MMICDGKHITYGPYRDGDTLNFSEDLADVTVSFDIGDHKIRDSRLVPSKYNTGSYMDTDSEWCVITKDGKVANCIENLYFTFHTKPEDTVKTDIEDEVKHPKHYTGHKSDIECIMFTELLPSLAANAFKYVWRCDDKDNHDEDLEKARWYLKRMYETSLYLKGPSDKIRYFMLGIIDASDFDDWHKRVLIKIVKGLYYGAYDEISDELGKPRHL